MRFCNLERDVFSIYDYNSENIQELICRLTADIEGVKSGEFVTNFENFLIVPKTDTQKWLDNLSDNSRILFYGTYTVQNLKITGKHGLTIACSGLIRQETDKGIKPGTKEGATSDSPLFKLLDCSNINITGLKTTSWTEALDIHNSSNITIEKCIFDGQNNGSWWSGVVIRDSDTVKIDNCIIKHFGQKPTYNEGTHKNNYVNVGEGIGGFSSKNLIFSNNTVVNNGKNGLYTHACSNVTMMNNNINENCMSGIQIAFGKGDESNFKIIGNTINYNYSDGIDINNTMGRLWDMKIVSLGNSFTQNGFFEKDTSKYTQDGSGVGTFTTVRGVYSAGNTVINCARPMVYIEVGEDIHINDYGVKTIGAPNSEGIIIRRSKNITISGSYYHSLEHSPLLLLDSTGGVTENIKLNNLKLHSANTISFQMNGDAFRGVTADNVIFNSAIKPNFVYDIMYNNCSFISQATSIDCNPIGKYYFNNCLFRQEDITSEKQLLLGANMYFTNCRFDTPLRIANSPYYQFVSCQFNKSKSDVGHLEIEKNASATVIGGGTNNSNQVAINVRTGCTLYKVNVDVQKLDSGTVKEITWR